MKNSLDVYLPNLQNKEDLAERLEDLVESISFDKHGDVKPDNCMYPGYYEYDYYPDNLKTVADVRHYNFSPKTTLKS